MIFANILVEKWVYQSDPPAYLRFRLEWRIWEIRGPLHGAQERVPTNFIL